MQEQAEGNFGKCVTPHQFTEPCALKVDSSFPVDTTKLSDGKHEAQVLVIDASGQRTFSAEIPFVVDHNLPTGPPADRTPPVLSAVTVSPSSLHLSNKAARRRGVVLHLSSSEQARLLISIEQRRPGKKPRHFATFPQSVGSGPSTVPLTLRIGRCPAPGTYRVRITARDGSGNVSVPLQRSFTVRPR